MSVRYRPWSPSQVHLLPPDPKDWLPKDHLAVFILEVVEQLDLSEIEERFADRDSRGNRAYDPRLMVALWIYAYCEGLTSSRKLERATYESLPFRVIAGECHPHFVTLATFRREQLQHLKGVFLQTVQIAREAGLVELQHLALDGTKIEANASKHKAMSYDRMKKKQDELERDVADFLARAEATDAAEDEEFGPEGTAEDRIVPEVRDPTKRLAWIKEQLGKLEREAKLGRADTLREQAEALQKSTRTAATPRQRKAAATLAKKRAEQASLFGEGDDDPRPASPDGLPLHRIPAERDGTPKPKAQRNFTDPDSRIMVVNGSFEQAYNSQAVVDAKHQIIVAVGVTNLAPDTQLLPRMVARARANLGRLDGACLTADAGYWSPDNVATCEAVGLDPFIATRRRRHGQRAAPPTGPPPDDAGPKKRMEHKLATERGNEMIRQRKAVVEPVFGQTKEIRGFRRYSMRGLEKASGEWAVTCAAHNLLKLYRAGWRPRSD